jgi:disulfide bond formation protein DsbB
MIRFAEYLSLVLSFATLLIHISFVLFVLSLMRERSRLFVQKTLDKAFPYAIWVGFFVSVAAVILSLVYSNVIGYPPCELCWWQRVFLYPQAILFAVALFSRKNAVVAIETLRASLVLSLFGIAVAAFQYYGQIWDPDILGACQSAGVSCAKIYFMHFGYITLPLMSLTAYAALIFIGLSPWILRKSNPDRVK